MDPRKLLSSTAQLSKWLEVMRQLRPEVNQDAISNLIPSKYKLLTANNKSDITGVAAYFLTASLQRGRYHYLADLVVDDKYRNKGVGSKILQSLLSLPFPCELDSGLARKQAHLFYEKHGFTSKSYAVRLRSEVVASINALSFDDARVINVLSPLQDLNALEKAQAFFDKQKNSEKFYKTMIGVFFTENPRHGMLILKNDNEQVEGVLIYEEQNRLSVGGRCLYVSDLIVNQDGDVPELQNILIMKLIALMKELNNSHQGDLLKTVIIEMTDIEIKNHELHEGKPQPGAFNEAAGVRVNSLFSVTAKHFIRCCAENSNQVEHRSWYQEHKNSMRN